MASVVLFFVLRLRNLGHPLIWDEALVPLAVKSHVLGLKNQWSSYINWHPPIYFWICIDLYRLGGRANSYELVSVLFSFGTLVVTYFLAKSLFNKKVASFSVFFLAVMPAATVMDTLIKQDATAGFFAILAIFLFTKKRYFWSGLALGIGMLSKETAIFALATIFLYAVFTRSRNRLKGAVMIGAIAAVMSFWWYLWVSSGVGNFWNFFRGTTAEAKLFAWPWYFYFQNLPRDLDWALAVLLVIGVVYSIYRWANGNEKYILPVVWFLFTYAFLSISVGKPFWMIPAAFPAMVILAAIGGLGAADRVTRRLRAAPRARYAVKLILALMLIAVVTFVTVNTTYAGYVRKKSLATWNETETAREDEEFLKSRLKPGELVFTVYLSVDGDPPFSYYLGTENEYPVNSGILGAPGILIDAVKKSGSRLIFIDNRNEPQETSASVQREQDFILQLLDQGHGKVLRTTSSSLTMEIDP